MQKRKHTNIATTRLKKQELIKVLATSTSSPIDWPSCVMIYVSGLKKVTNKILTASNDLYSYTICFCLHSH